MGGLEDRLNYLIQRRDIKGLSTAETLVLVIDVQRAFTDPNAWLAKSLFNGQVSATNEMKTKIGNFALTAHDSGYQIFVTRIVHDIEKLASLDPERLKLLKSKGIVVDDQSGTSVLACAPKSTDLEFDFGESLYQPSDDKVFEKCSRSVVQDPHIKKAIEDGHFKNVVLVGMDANVCIYESAKDLADLGEQVIIPIDLISTRPVEIDETITKFRELNTRSILFCNSEGLLLTDER